MREKIARRRPSKNIYSFVIFYSQIPVITRSGPTGSMTSCTSGYQEKLKYDHVVHVVPLSFGLSFPPFCRLLCSAIFALNLGMVRFAYPKTMSIFLLKIPYK